MKILTVYFDHGEERYKKLYNVFLQSLKINSPGVEVESINISPPAREISIARNCTDNTVKLKIWHDYAMSHDDDLVLIDCDMLNLNDCSKMFDSEFDIAFTFASSKASKAPMNGGVVALKRGHAGREFLKTWLDVNNRMYRDRKFHKTWQAKYLGMNQAAFGYIYENMDFNIGVLPTQKWNAIDTDWNNIDSETVFVHIKSELRHAVLSNTTPIGPYAYAMTEWYKYRDMLPQTTENEKKSKNKPRRVNNYRRPKHRGRIR